MKATINLLLELQKVDSERRSVEEVLEMLPSSRENATAEFEQASSAPVRLSQEIKNIRVQIAKKELELKGCEDKIARLKKQLISASSNREYRTLKHEIDGQEADKSLIEDEALNLMTKCDELEKSLAAVKHALEAKRAEHERSLREAADQERRLNEETKKLSHLREELASGVNAEVMSIYERLIERYRTDAVVSVNSDEMYCGGCHMAVQPQIINLLMKNEEIIHCKSCGRILYLE